MRAYQSPAGTSNGQSPKDAGPGARRSGDHSHASAPAEVSSFSVPDWGCRTGHAVAGERLPAKDSIAIMCPRHGARRPPYRVHRGCKQATRIDRPDSTLGLRAKGTALDHQLSGGLWAIRHRSRPGHQPPAQRNQPGAVSSSLASQSGKKGSVHRLPVNEGRYVHPASGQQ